MSECPKRCRRFQEKQKPDAHGSSHWSAELIPMSLRIRPTARNARPECGLRQEACGLDCFSLRAMNGHQNQRPWKNYAAQTESNAADFFSGLESTKLQTGKISPESTMRNSTPRGAGRRRDTVASIRLSWIYNSGGALPVDEKPSFRAESMNSIPYGIFASERAFLRS